MTKSITLTNEIQTNINLVLKEVETDTILDFIKMRRYGEFSVRFDPIDENALNIIDVELDSLTYGSFVVKGLTIGETSFDIVVSTYNNSSQTTTELRETFQISVVQGLDFKPRYVSIRLEPV